MNPKISTTFTSHIGIGVALGFAVSTLFGSQVFAQASKESANALQAFEVVRSVLQHPRCQNCHITGDAPLQGDEGRQHGLYVKRGPKGHGAVAMECSVCHQSQNLPGSYGKQLPPGAPNWHLPPPETKMVFKDLSPRALCLGIKNRRVTGGKDLDAMLEHMRNDKLVAWGWEPGEQRSIPQATRAETVTAFKTWIDAGAPCPTQ